MTTLYKFKYDKKQHTQKCGGKKLTQPNMSYSIQEMIEASNRGLSVRVDTSLQYLDNEDDSLLQVNDLTDIDEIKETLTEFNKKRDDVEKKRLEKVYKTNLEKEAQRVSEAKREGANEATS